MLARAESIGVEARRALAENGRGRVAAVFASSLYVRFGDAWACLGGRNIGRGPLNVPCDAVRPKDWREVTALGSPAVVRGGRLHLSDGFVVLGGAPDWQSTAAPSWTISSLASGLRALSAALPADLPKGGLAGFIGPAVSPRTMVEKVAAPAVEELSRWAATPPGTGTGCPSGAVSALLGLGPGLTPSGDDFLAGFVVALRTVRHLSTARTLSREISEKAPNLTSDLSAAHLQSAIRAGLNEDMQTLLHALLTGRSGAITAGVTKLSAKAHYSSWDMLAGIATALRKALSHKTA